MPFGSSNAASIPPGIRGRPSFRSRTRRRCGRARAAPPSRRGATAGRDAEIDLLAAHGQLDAPVLRQPPLGDVEPRHDLDARDDRRLQPRRRRLDFVQHAVIAVADPQPILERLDMDVGGMGLDGAGDQLVDEADHRRLARQVLQPLGILFGRLGVGDTSSNAAFAAPRRRRARNKAGRAPLRVRSAPRPRPRPAGRSRRPPRCG